MMNTSSPCRRKGDRGRNRRRAGRCRYRLSEPRFRLSPRSSRCRPWPEIEPRRAVPPHFVVLAGAELIERPVPDEVPEGIARRRRWRWHVDKIVAENCIRDPKGSWSTLIGVEVRDGPTDHYAGVERERARKDHAPSQFVHIDQASLGRRLGRWSRERRIWNPMTCGDDRGTLVILDGRVGHDLSPVVCEAPRNTVDAMTGADAGETRYRRLLDRWREASGVTDVTPSTRSSSWPEWNSGEAL